MAWLDVSAVALDPQFASSFRVWRRRQLVDATGVAAPALDSTTWVRGVVVPEGNNTLARAPGFESQANALRVITPFRLRTASRDQFGNEWLPDLLEWQGAFYVVETSNEFANGSGFLDVNAIMTTYNPPPSANLQPVPPFWLPPSLDWSLPRNTSLRLLGWA